MALYFFEVTQSVYEELAHFSIFLFSSVRFAGLVMTTPDEPNMHGSSIQFGSSGVVTTNLAKSNGPSA